ncbi:MAG: PBSX family phage terminase large subunit [Ruminococcus sp.]|nr:PBSX family phage terminase large subunit [Ruminococcus sp.]
MMLETLSAKQQKVFTWWRDPDTDAYDAIICDGAVRSGKTFALTLSFVTWAMTSFTHKRFALCSKTIGSLKRNILPDVFSYLDSLGWSYRWYPSKNKIEVTFSTNTNTFYLFGGRDESSAALIQGITLAGALFDEVVLMPRSFVEQAAARCSVSGSRLFMCCNPDAPSHWFKREWIDKSQQKNLFYMHFTMEDNPSLSDTVKQRYKRLYHGAFYDRFVLGRWTAVQGVVYPMFSRSQHVTDTVPECDRYAVSCDYGTVNPASFGLWGHRGGIWYRLREYYYDSRREGSQRTDEEHYRALEQLIGEHTVDGIVCDPSAASFIECIRRHGDYRVIPANNDVIKGIRLTSDCLKAGKLRFHSSCEDILREFDLYRWDERAGRDAPIKENDHAMDDMRYFVCEYLAKSEDALCVISVDRNR